MTQSTQPTKLDLYSKAILPTTGQMMTLGGLILMFFNVSFGVYT